MYICMVAYMGAVGILPERVVSACSAYLVNCVFICMVAYMGVVGKLPERVVSACSAYFVNCVCMVAYM